MIKVFKLFLFLLLIFSPKYFAQDKWEVLENKEFSFRISFPGKTTNIIDTLVYEKFKVYKNYWDCEYMDSVKGNAFLSISVCPYPSDFVHSDSSNSLIEQVLNSLKEDVAANDHYIFVFGKVIEKNGYQGRYFNWRHVKNEELISAQVFLVDSVVYTLYASSFRGIGHDKFCEDFFTAFEIVNKKKGNYSNPQPQYKPTYFLDFPSPPVSSTQTIIGDSLKLIAHSSSLSPEDKTDNISFIANEVEYPNKFGVLDDYKYNLLYSKTLGAAISRISGDIISLKEINYKGTPGKECKAYIYQGAAIIVLRTFMIDNILYQFGVITTPENEGNFEMKKFLDSFKVL